MKIKELISIIKCNRGDTIEILNQDGKVLFSFYYCNIENTLKYFMNRKIDHISIGLEDETISSNTKLNIFPVLKIFIKDKQFSVKPIDFIRDKIDELFEDENGINFWPSNKNHKITLIINNGAKNIAYGTYELNSYINIEDFTSSYRWAILEELLKGFDYVSHRIDNDEEYTLYVEVEHNDINE